MERFCHTLTERARLIRLLDVLGEEGIGCIVFSPRAQGLLSDKYLSGVPSDSRAVIGDSFDQTMLTEENLARVRGLNQIAQERGQSLAQMAVVWVLRDPRVKSALVGALDNLGFSEEELAAIDRYAVDGSLNLWQRPARADLGHRV